MAAPPNAKLIVWTKSGGLCSFTGCRMELLLEPDYKSTIPLGEVAHIVAEQLDGPRGAHHFTLEQRNQPANLMLLCPNHHTEVDKAPQLYTIERLMEFKRAHEHWVRQSLSNGPNFRGKPILAVPPLVQETVHSTVLPIERVPKYVYMGKPTVSSEDELKEMLEYRPPFIWYNNQICTFENLKSLDNAFAKVIDPLQANRESAEDWYENPDKYRLYVQLLNRCLNKVTGRRGLMLDRDRKRYWFTQDEPDTVKRVQYRPLNDNSSSISVVWQPIQKSTKQPYGYWLHRAISFQVHLIDKRSWLLALRPEFHVTSDGINDYESSEIGARVTRKKSRMYNFNVLSEVQFWRDYLSESQPRIVVKFLDQQFVIGTKLIQSDLLWPGVPDDQRSFKNVSIEENLFSLQEYEEFSDEGPDSDEFDIEGDADEEE